MDGNRTPKDVDNAETPPDGVDANFEDEGNVLAISPCKPFLGLKDDISSPAMTFNLARLIDS